MAYDFLKKSTNIGITMFNVISKPVLYVGEDNSLAYETDFDMVLDIIIIMIIDFLNNLMCEKRRATSHEGCLNTRADIIVCFFLVFFLEIFLFFMNNCCTYIIIVSMIVDVYIYGYFYSNLCSVCL